MIWEKDNPNKKARSTYWGSIAYLDSLPDNWYAVIDGFDCHCLVSPLHNRDTKFDGELKKPHYHIIYIFESLKSYEQVKYFSDQLRGTIPIQLNCISKAIRYLWHADNKDKFLYCPDDVQKFGHLAASMFTDALNVNKVIAPQTELINYLINIILDNGFTTLYEFIFYVKDNADLAYPSDELLNCISKRTYFFKCLIYDMSCLH